MAENDYIGNIQTNRWNSLNQGYLTRTPSWMQGAFKQGPQVSTQRFRATTSGAQLNWGQGDTTPRLHAFGAKEKGSNWEQNQQPGFLANLMTKRSSSRTSARTAEYEGSM